MGLNHKTRAVVQKSGRTQSHRIEEEIDLSISSGSCIAPVDSIFSLISAKKSTQRIRSINSCHLSAGGAD